MDYKLFDFPKKGKKNKTTKIDLSMKLVDTHCLLHTRTLLYICYIYLDRDEYICLSRSIEIVVCCMALNGSARHQWRHGTPTIHHDFRIMNNNMDQE